MEADRRVTEAEVRRCIRLQIAILHRDVRQLKVPDVTLGDREIHTELLLAKLVFQILLACHCLFNTLELLENTDAISETALLSVETLDVLVRRLLDLQFKNLGTVEAGACE